MKTFRECLREGELNEAKNILDDITIVYSAEVKDFGGFVPNSVIGLTSNDNLRSIGNFVKINKDVKDIIRIESKIDPKDVKTIVKAYTKVYPKFNELVSNIKDKGIDSYFTVSFDIHPRYRNYITKQNLSNVFKKYEVLDIISTPVYGNNIYVCILSSKTPTSALEIYKNSKSLFDKFLKINNIELSSSEYVSIKTMIRSFFTDSTEREKLSNYIKPELRQLYSFDFAACDAIRYNESGTHFKSLMK